MAGQTSPFSPEEVQTLRKFRKVCEDIASCRFIQTISNQKHMIKGERLPDGTFRILSTAYDKDDFLAFLTHYRKLVAAKEDTQVFKIMNIVGKHGSAQDRAGLKQIRKLINGEAKQPPMQIAIGLPEQEISYSPEQIQNVIFNAQVFHSDDALQDDLAKLHEFDPFKMQAFLRYAITVINHAQRISGVLKHRGVV